MFVDSHCHLSFPELASRLARNPRGDGAGPGGPGAVHLHHAGGIRGGARAGHGLRQFLGHGRRPSRQRRRRPSPASRIWSARSARPRVVAIGETGLDYYQMDERKGGRAVADMEWQRERFRTHIRAARQVGKPLVIHTRAASADTVAHPEGRGRRRLARRGRRRFPLLYRNRRGGPCRAGPGLLHLVFGHPDFQERAGPARCRRFRAAGPAADRNRQPLSGAGAVPGQDQQSVLRAICRPAVGGSFGRWPWKRSPGTPAPISSACSASRHHEKLL